MPYFISYLILFLLPNNDISADLKKKSHLADIPISKNFNEFSDQFDQSIKYTYSNTLLVLYCCDDLSELPPIGAIVSGTIRAGYEQLKYNIWRNSRILMYGDNPNTLKYRKYFLEKDEWTGKFHLVYHEFEKEPDWNKRIKDNTFAGLELMSLFPSSSSLNTLVAKTPKSFTVNMIQYITEKFGNFECLACADAVIKNLKKADIQGQIVELNAKGNKSRMAGNIYNETVETLISTNGRHRGVLVEGKVYDNIYKNGIELDEWVKKFDSPLGFELTKIDF